MAEILPLSREELAGLVEMRRLLAALRRRGDEHCMIQWMWHGTRLVQLKVVDYSILVNTEAV